MQGGGSKIKVDSILFWAPKKLLGRPFRQNSAVCGPNVNQNDVPV